MTGLMSKYERNRERVFRAIFKNPGISLSELSRKTQLMCAWERRQFLNELIAADRIVERKEQPIHGPTKTILWPKEW